MRELLTSYFFTVSSNLWWVTIGSLLLGVTAGVVGCLSFLQKRSLAGDTLAHAALPGVTTAFLIWHNRDPLVLALGATGSCLFAFALVEGLTRYTKIKEDSALAIALSFFFSIGAFQLSYLQKLPIAGQAGLDKMLFGQAASLTNDDIQVLLVLGTINLLFVMAFFHKLTSISFDADFCRAIGIRVQRYQAAFILALVFTVVIGLQLVGVVLMAAVLVTPAAAARYWSDRVTVVTILSGVFGGVAGVCGAIFSAVAPRMPTGPWIVVTLTVIFLTSLLCAPERGVIAHFFRQRSLRRRVQEENILKVLYQTQERNPHLTTDRGTISSFHLIHPKALEQALLRLTRQAEVVQKDHGYILTQKGQERAASIVRMHRLWERYLTDKVLVPADHVHDNAEFVEHVLTPELEDRIKKELSSPTEDPHGRKIPW